MSTSANILTHQDQIIGYLRNEYDRLNTRLERAGNKVKTQNRSSELYESARLKQEDKIAMLAYITALFGSYYYSLLAQYIDICPRHHI